MMMATSADNLEDNEIRTYSQPWPDLSPDYGAYISGIFTGVLLIGMALVNVAAVFGIELVYDRELNTRGQMRISGLTFAQYWLGVFFSDYLQYMFVCLLSLIAILALQLPGFMNGGAVLTILLLYILYMPVLLLIQYCFAYMFENTKTAVSFMPVFNTFISFIPYMIVTLLLMNGLTESAEILHYIFTVTNPMYGVYAGLFFIGQVYIVQMLTQFTLEPNMEVWMYFTWDSNIPIVLIMAPVHFLWSYFLLRFLDIRSTGGDPRDTCPCSRNCDVSPIVDKVNHDIIEDEDEDVRAERLRADSLVATATGGQLPCLASNLRKEFIKGGKKCSCACDCCCAPDDEEVKVAVRNNSFVVEAGEVFGLLGPNGAGKTTTLNMIIAEQAPTCGKVFVAGHDIRSSISEAFQVMGYCPQHDVQWETLTLKEHIEVYAKIRGIPKQHIDEVAMSYIKALQIEEHADKYSDSLSGGTKRKLSYIISMLADPLIALFDEPSTGMDPASKRFMWDTISKAFTGNERGAILTTHSMEEADALCSRVGIMVNGKLRCIGSTQHLKNKYGSGYVLEVKLNGETGKLSDLRHFVTDLFPNNTEVECFNERATFKVPREDVGDKISKAFAALEGAKERLGIEEYSFSQATLEQVFIEFAKAQKEEGEDDEETDMIERQLSSQLSQPDSGRNDSNNANTSSDHPETGV